MNIIFDLGGVVLSWDPWGLIEKVSPDPIIRERLFQGVFAHADWAEYDRGGFGAEEALTRFTAHTGLPVDLVGALLTSVAPSLQPFPETIALMTQLEAAGHHLYCLSNMNIPAGDYIRQTWDFWSLFRGVVISCDVKLIKPDPDIFEFLVRKYALVPGESVFIDDMAINLKTAASLGIHTLLFSGPDTCRQELEQWFLR